MEITELEPLHWTPEKKIGGKNKIVNKRETAVPPTSLLVRLHAHVRRAALLSPIVANSQVTKRK